MFQFEPDDVELLLHSGRQLASVRSLDEAAVLVCRLARKLSRADGVTFVLREGAFVAYVEGEAFDPLWKGRRFPIEACLSGWSMLHRQTVAIADIEADPRVPLERLRSSFVRSVAMVPVRPAAPVAAIGAYWRRTGAPSARAIALLEATASYAALAVYNARRFGAVVVARQATARAERATGELLAWLDGERRDSLAPMLAALHVVKARGSDPRDGDRAIDRQLDRVVRLVDRLLDEPPRPAAALRRAPLELAQIVAGALDATRLLLDERRHRVVVAVPSRGLALDADAERLVQAVANLLANAAKFTPPGGRIDLVGEREAGWVRLVVRDNGAGIAPEQLARILALEDPAHDLPPGGLGLGLAIVRGIAALHGGTLSAASEGPGRGASFTLALPASTSAPALPAIRPMRFARALVVDDDLDAAAALGDQLAALGHEPLVVPDVASARASLESFTPELAFVDLGLPMLDGYELAVELRARPRLAAIPLIALGGLDRPADRERARVAGFTEHLVEPRDQAQLRALIARLVG
ncbi:MAG: hybrid sensor histidine kinase/response regulator [Kofleriaceae bacterium]